MFRKKSPLYAQISNQCKSFINPCFRSLINLIPTNSKTSKTPYNFKLKPKLRPLNHFNKDHSLPTTHSYQFAP